MEHTHHIETASDFRAFVEDLAETEAVSYQGSLEDYLRSLWTLIQDQHDDLVSFALLASLLEKAFSTQPASFDKHWLTYTRPPSMVYPNQVLDDFGYLRDVILYQIADLHRLNSTGDLDKPPHILWLGVQSPTCGHFWYSFHPESYLKSAVQGLSPDSNNFECNWGDLAVFLWIGQIYE